MWFHPADSIVASAGFALIAILMIVSATVVPAQGARGAPSGTADPMIAASDQGRIMGSESAKIWMLIVSDFQCPFCKQWHDSTWKTIQREYVATGKLRVAHVNFPLGNHANARPAAIEAMCAAVQGKFWPVADALYATQDRWKNLPNPRAFFDGISGSARVDASQQRACVAGTAIPSLVDADRTRMSRAGAQSTPTFFIGGSRIEGAQPVQEFRRVIDAELAGRRP